MFPKGTTYTVIRMLSSYCTVGGWGSSNGSLTTTVPAQQQQHLPVAATASGHYASLSVDLDTKPYEQATKHDTPVEGVAAAILSRYSNTRCDDPGQSITNPTTFATSRNDEPSSRTASLPRELMPHNTALLRQARPLSLPPTLQRRIGPPSTHPTRPEEIRGGALMLVDPTVHKSHKYITS